MQNIIEFQNLKAKKRKFFVRIWEKKYGMYQKVSAGLKMYFPVSDSGLRLYQYN